MHMYEADRNNYVVCYKMPYKVVKSGRYYKIKSGSKVYKTKFLTKQSAQMKIKAMQQFTQKFSKRNKNGR